MRRTAVSAAVLSAAPAAAWTSQRSGGLRGRGAALLDDGSALRPDVAADLFGKVADSWVHARTVASEGAAAQAGAQSSDLQWAVASCGKVANAVLQGSDGDVSKVHEYMGIVCSKDDKLPAEMKDLCLSFAEGLEHDMSGDVAFNRDLDPSRFCKAFYTGPVEVVAQARRAKAEEERKAEQAREATKKAEEDKQRAAELERLQALEAEATAAAAQASAMKANTTVDSNVTDHAQELVAKLGAQAAPPAASNSTGVDAPKAAAAAEAAVAETVAADAPTAPLVNATPTVSASDATAMAVVNATPSAPVNATADAPADAAAAAASPALAAPAASAADAAAAAPATAQPAVAAPAAPAAVAAAAAPATAQPAAAATATVAPATATANATSTQQNATAQAANATAAAAQ